ncbi:MAG TPA: hypothetical protein VNF27_09245 [Candidatus Binataceae bacterium]|nr:hypothetical protein [Candidatus Binataceae bacterium]
MSAAPHPIGYASIAAFLAHYRALEASRELADGERRTLAEMRAMLDSLETDERAALESAAADSSAERRRDRVLRKLRRELLERGVISG